MFDNAKDSHHRPQILHLPKDIFLVEYEGWLPLQHDIMAHLQCYPPIHSKYR